MKEYSGQKIFEKIGKHATLKNKKVLEIGCGSGRISSLLAEECNALVAIDPDEKDIENARARIPGVDFRVGSGEKLDFPDSSFDLVIFTLSLHHQDSRKALKEAARVAKPGGRILVVEPVTEGETENVFAFLHDENRNTICAQDAIVNSGLPMVASETFTADWVFENEDDLYRSLFDYYEMPFDSGMARKISDFLGEKIKSNPIVLSDRMIIQALENRDAPN
jgi:SAM-dependent methyltransferase